MIKINKFYFLTLISFLLLQCKKDSQNYRYDIIYQSFFVDSSKLNNDTVFYDLDNDNINDIAIMKKIDTIDNKIHYVSKIFSLKEIILFTYYKIRPSTLLLDTLDIIDSSDKYSWTDVVHYEYETNYINGSSDWMNGIFADYVGFQIINGDKINYGWFHVYCFLIKEIAYNKTTNLSIRIGQRK